MKRKALNLTPTPYSMMNVGVSARRPINRDAVIKFHNYLYEQYKDKPFYEYDLAKKLNVHRIVVEEWVDGLYDYQLILGSGGSHRVLKPKDIFFVQVKACVNYDPWKDRTWDKKFNDTYKLYFIDEYIDKYYSLWEDEVLKYTGKPRQYTDGTYFIPPICKRLKNDHPNNFTDSAKQKFAKPGQKIIPSITRREEIKKLCRGEAQASPKSIFSWITENYFKTEDTARVEQRSAKLRKIPLSLKRKGIIRRGQPTK